MTSDPLDWLFGLERLGMKFGLENMTRLMRELGDPHRRFPSVLIGGTNGKGSVSAMVDAVLRWAGYRSARYTSPHLVRLEERFLIDGSEVETGHLARAVEKVRRAVEALEVPATFFECTTAAAFELFAGTYIDLAVLEVGLGGRLDATNVVTPLVSAITTIDFDHQAQLGTTIEAIAGEKAGIIKPGVPVVIGRLPVAARSVIDQTARRVGAPIVPAIERALIPPGTRLALAGRHQEDNALVAVALVRSLAGFNVTDADLRQGLETVRWPGRLEHLKYGTCDVLIDAAHNPAGAQALASYLEQIGWLDATLLFGAMSDKDAAAMLERLASSVRRIVVTTAPTPRAESAAALGRMAQAAARGKPIDVIEQPHEALAHACAVSTRVVVAGSIFLIGPLRDILR